jgi:hypothetical protein
MDYESSVYILHMLKDGAGHAVGIEFVPGKDKTGEGPGQKGYPPFYQFIDPNTGLFLFDAFRGLQVFFTVPVVKFYAPKTTTHTSFMFIEIWQVDAATCAAFVL